MLAYLYLAKLDKDLFQFTLFEKKNYLSIYSHVPREKIGAFNEGFFM